MKIGKIIFNGLVSFVWVINIVVYATSGELPKFTIYTALIVTLGFFVLQTIDGVCGE